MALKQDVMYFVLCPLSFVFCPKQDCILNINFVYTVCLFVCFSNISRLKIMTIMGLMM